MKENNFNLKKYRYKLGFTQSEMAELFNIGLRGYQNWEGINGIPYAKKEFVFDKIKELLHKKENLLSENNLLNKSDYKFKFKNNKEVMRHVINNHNLFLEMPEYRKKLDAIIHKLLSKQH